jgi:hypothetical protein
VGDTPHSWAYDAWLQYALVKWNKIGLDYFFFSEDTLASHIIGYKSIA